MQHDTVYGDINGDGLLSDGERTATGSLRTIYLSYISTSHYTCGGRITVDIIKFLPGLTNAGTKT
jgi:putative membrane protein